MKFYNLYQIQKHFKVVQIMFIGEENKIDKCVIGKMSSNLLKYSEPQA